MPKEPESTVHSVFCYVFLGSFQFRNWTESINASVIINMYTSGATLAAPGVLVTCQCRLLSYIQWRFYFLPLSFYFSNYKS
jgi:hypothetical protein